MRRDLPCEVKTVLEVLIAVADLLVIGLVIGCITRGKSFTDTLDD